MAVIVGSARVDERGKYKGGQAGSQISKEISKQNWYLHRKGWVVIRAKDPKKAEKIAKNMEYACDSPYVGYDQSQNQTLYNVVKSLDFDISKLKVKCETDCARLVRVCVKYAGINAEDFYTGTLVSTLKKTNEFEIFTDAKHCKSSDYLKRGDILVTKTKGHTVVVLSDGAKVEKNEVTNEVKVEATVKVDPAKSFSKLVAGTYVTTANLNLRAGAGTSNKKITVMKKGESVKCYGYYTKVDGVKWYLVSYNGKNGFASSKYLKKK
jgi:hypothetical protein